MKKRKLISFVLTLTFIITCAIGYSSIQGNAFQLSAFSPSTPTQGVGSLFTGVKRVLCDSNGYIDTVYVYNNEIGFNFISPEADLTKTRAFLQKETTFRTSIFSSQQEIPVTIGGSGGQFGGVSWNNISLQGPGRYKLTILSARSNNTFLDSQTINVIYMDYYNNNYFVNEAWNQWQNQTYPYSGGKLNFHAKIHDLDNLGIDKSDVHIRFYKEGYPNNYVVSTDFTLRGFPHQYNTTDTDYDFYVYGTVNSSSFGNAPGRYIVQLYLFGIPWQQTVAVVG
jgi:hypothetical protein